MGKEHDYLGKIREIIEGKMNTALRGRVFNKKVASPEKFYAVLGKGISYSLSPIMHNTVFAESGMECEYKIIDGELEECVNWLKERGAGANVTIPYKEKIIPYLSGISKDAREIGAVNTVKKLVDGSLEGHNTDYLAIRELISPYPGKVVIFGSGGGSRAAAYAAMGREVVIISRNREEAAKKYLGWNVKVDNYDNAEEIVKDSKIIINASPSVPDISDYITPNHVVFDMRYNPLDVGLNRMAIEKGAKIIHGLEMLALQAAEAQGIWFGKRPNPEIMLAAALNELTKSG